nr:MAG TPA: major capsid protein [Caudoviricetes sp.]
MELYKMKEDLATIGAQIHDDASWIAANAGDPKVDFKELEAKKAHRDELQKRFDMLKEQHDDIERRGKENVKKQVQSEGDPKTKLLKAKGEFYKAVLTGESPREVFKAYEMLGAIPAADADLGYGDKLLPTTMSNELIIEPMTENPMRGLVRVSQIRGLEEPKLLFDLDGAYDAITDKETAKEIKMSGDSVTYGRNKVKPIAKISDSVLHGSPVSIAQEVDNALRSGLAMNEMTRMFATTPEVGYENMSFYSTQNAVKKVQGTDKRTAIAKAIADLPIMFRRNARIVMNAIDWYDMWGGNLNQAGMYFEDRPLSLFGKQVTLVDDATDPVVGDFSYARINYDIGTIYDTDKDVDKGVYKFVLTAWYDIRLRLASAFRIATVKAA